LKIIEIRYFFKVDRSPRKLWRSVGMSMEEEYSPKWGSETGMRNTLDGVKRSGKVRSLFNPHL
jgi:hypothetical protein